LEDLRQMNRVTQSFKYTKESAANMVSAIRQWLYFTVFFSLQILPATTDSLVCFCEFMARSVSFQHVKHCLQAVQFLHQALNVSFPCDSFQLDMTLQGLKRRLARVAFQVLPISPPILRAIFSHLDMEKPQDLALWCSFLISFYGLLRKKSVVPKAGPFDPNKVLVRRHLNVHLPTNTVYVYLGFSKTNQFGARDLVLPILGNSDPALDPVRHLHALFSRVNAPADAPAFTYAKGKHITYNSFTTRLKSLLTKAGYPASHFSGHSFRRGGATYLYKCGGSQLMVQSSGDWSSTVFTKYLFLSTAERWKSQYLISQCISAAG
jgi:hypothetical protein